MKKKRLTPLQERIRTQIPVASQVANHVQHCVLTQVHTQILDPVWTQIRSRVVELSRQQLGNRTRSVYRPAKKANP